MTEIFSLPDLATQINAEHSAATTAANTAVQHALNAGQLLIEAKKLVAHGEWLPWIAANCQLADRTVQGYMRLARELPKLDGPKAQRVADLPLREALALLADDRMRELKPTSPGADWLPKNGLIARAEVSANGKSFQFFMEEVPHGPGFFRILRYTHCDGEIVDDFVRRGIRADGIELLDHFFTDGTGYTLANLPWQYAREEIPLSPWGAP
ncbi:MAG: DUF3102 domain-containing protein [Gammaproteobacteria bacterium]|nr:DUF3102 domain-containing protein [Gammaproteobacteria bacterium]